jgi:DNA-binding HxlR family transcriptional regulator
MGCAMDSLLRLLMGQWTCYILWTLCQNGPQRFGELKRSVVGVSSKVLTERLRLLEESGIIYREHVPTIPPQVTYGLSERGKELVTALRELASIAKRWCEEDGKSNCSDTSTTTEPDD